LRATLWVLLADLPPDLPLLLLATADVPAGELDPEARTLFGGPQVRAGRTHGSSSGGCKRGVLCLGDGRRPVR